jgi:hypothetical protein
MPFVLRLAEKQKSSCHLEIYFGNRSKASREFSLEVSRLFLQAFCLDELLNVFCQNVRFDIDGVARFALA